MSSSFDKMAIVTASTKRSAYADKQFSEPVESIASLSCTPVDPATRGLLASLDLETTYEMKHTFVAGGLDIKAGDLLIVGSKTYDVRYVGEWYWPTDLADYLILILQDSKR